MERPCFGCKTANFAVTRSLHGSLLPKYFAPAGTTAVLYARTVQPIIFWGQNCGRSSKSGFWAGAENRPENPAPKTSVGLSRPGAAQGRFRKSTGPCMGTNRPCRSTLASITNQRVVRSHTIANQRVRMAKVDADRSQVWPEHVTGGGASVLAPRLVSKVMRIER